jgi:hypothetical protein
VPVADPAPAPSPQAAATPPARVPTGPGSNPGPITSGPGPIGGGAGTVFEVHEGDERAFSFSFYILPTVYTAPGEDNLIVQFRGEEGESPSFGLQLWDDGSGTQRGLWSSGDAMGGERFLAPVTERVWHEAVVYFQASSQGDGFYLLTLDDQPIDVRAWVSLIDSGSSDTQIEVGLFRGGEPVFGAPDIFFGPTQLGESSEPVLP